MNKKGKLCMQLPFLFLLPLRREWVYNISL